MINVQIEACEAAVLRILEESGHDHPLEACNYVLEHTDIACDAYCGQGISFDTHEIEEIINEILAHPLAPAKLKIECSTPA